MKSSNRTEILKIVKAFLMLRSCASARELSEFVNAGKFLFDDGCTVGEMKGLLKEALTVNHGKRILDLGFVQVNKADFKGRVYYLKENEELVLDHLSKGGFI